MRRRFRRALLLAVCLGPAGCAGRTLTREDVEPAQVARIRGDTSLVKAHLRNGDVIVFAPWRFDSASRTINGRGERLDANRRLVARGEQSISVDSIALLETNQLHMHPAYAALAVMTVASAALSVYCLSNPKACFGSCPTFYVSDGARDVLQAEGFSASIAPSLEATDVDALYRARPTSRSLEVRMTNEALETHNVRFVRVIAARRGEGERVLATDDRTFWHADDLQPPSRCVAVEGDCTGAVATADGVERFSLADSTDLATKETIELRFDSIPRGSLGLAIASRQTLLSTYLFYQTLAYMGHSMGDWLAMLDRGDARMRSHATAIADRLGGIEVQVRGRFGIWHTVGETRETGPLATDLRVVRLPPLPRDTRLIRLRLTRGLWRIDQVALARLLAPAEVVRLDPVAVAHGGVDDTTALAALRDSTRMLTTLPGDVYTLRYRLPEDFARYELFLESRGYYLEWMREPWLAEDDQARAVRVFRDPARVLRELAPAYKRQEAGMEAAFWGSRYERP